MPGGDNPDAARSADLAHQLADFEPRRRRRLLVRITVNIILTWTVIVVVYYEEPFERLKQATPLATLAIYLLIVAAVVALQAWRIIHSDTPVLRAAQALALIVPLFLFMFASVYLSMSLATPTTFSQALDHTRALYFTVTTFSTVGFGDITPRTDPARILVSFQMLLDMVVVGVIVKVLLGAAKTGLERRTQV